jgi:speckle-type POZ protein
VLDGQCPTTDTADFIKRSELEASYLRDDRIVIECDLTVVLGATVTESRIICEVQVPPSDALDSFGKFLVSGEGADVTFKVQDEVFPAHKIVLAMRSPVFKAELLGPMSDKSGKEIAVHIEDMQPVIFKALLYFIYNDSLPGMEDVHENEHEEMVKHMLVAADRYGMERMKVICESVLSKKLAVETVATTLALADQHHCSQLKDACMEFISSSNILDDVVDSRGYAHLKRACPVVIAKICEKLAKSRKI